MKRKLEVVAAVFTIALILGAIVTTRQFLQSYLFAWLFWLGIALGSVALLMMHDLTGGKWGNAIRGPLSAAALTLPLLAILFIPVLAGVHALYPWTHSNAPQVIRKAIYLNIPFFIVRAVLYFACWIALAWATVRRRARFAPWAGGGLVLYSVTMTFAGWDWMMSLEPKWWSTIYGMIVITGQGISALALMVIVAALWHRTDEQLHDLGNLLLAFVIFWTYVSFSQLLLIYAGDIKEEIAWYLPRLQTSWMWLAVALISFFFFAPLIVLLFRFVTRNAILLAAVGVLLLAMRGVDLFWTIAPAFHPARFTVSWLDFVAPIALGAIWLIAFRWLLQRPEIRHA